MLSAGSSQAQLNVWRWQNPLPEGDFLHAVQMFSLNTTYACGENGVFMRTNDGGATWEVQSTVLKFKGTWNSFNFINENFGMCCGDSGTAMKTTDGGISWTLMPTGTVTTLNGVIIIDTNIALMILLNGGILKTINGGASWHPIISEGSFALYSIRKLRPDFLYVTGFDGTLRVSIDTGNTWRKITTPNGNTFYGACFTGENDATLVGDNGLVLQTTNGGTDWMRTDSNDVTETLNAVDGRDPSHLGIAGNYGTILYMTDSGWNKYSPGTSDHLKAISFFDNLNATAVGRDGVILRTTDGGMNWFFLPEVPQTTLLQSVAFPKGDTSLGVAVGYNGIIMRTSDGGKNWKIIPSGFSDELRGVACLDQSNVIAVGDYGAIFKSYDGGQSWKRLTSPTNNTIYSVSFATPDDGLAVGDSNMVLKTINAGESWIKQVNPGASYIDSNPITPKVVRGFLPLYSVSYPDKNHAFMSARLDNFYTSSDGGVSWKDTFIARWIPSVSFSDSLHGGYVYTVWGGGLDEPVNVTFTTDGGKTWVRDHNIGWLSKKDYLNGIYCVDNLHATAVGNKGYIGHTTNGGVTWNEQQSNTQNNLNGVCFGTVKAGTAVGLRGNIMRITTDEEPASLVKNVTNEQAIGIDVYPNPSSNLVTIQYYLPSSGSSRIEMYSMAGILISRMPEEYKSAGNYSTSFDATGLESGTYFFRIINNGLKSERKIIISK